MINLFDKKENKKNNQELFLVDNNMKNQLNTIPQMKGISKGEFIREAINEKIRGIGNGLHYKLNQIQDQIKQEQEIINEQTQIINKHKAKQEKLKNEYIKLEKLIDQSNIIYHEEEQKIKEIILNILTNPDQRFWKNITKEDIKRMILERANQTHTDINITTRLTNLILSSEISLRELIEKPIQHIIDDVEIEELENTEFTAIKNNLWNKYKEYIKKDELKQKERQKEETIKQQSLNTRVQYTIQQIFKRKYRTTDLMKGYLQNICKYTTNVDYDSIIGIVEQIYNNKLDYNKVINSKNILDTYTTTTKPENKTKNIKEETNNNYDKKLALKTLLKSMYKKGRLTKSENLNYLEGDIRRICKANKFLEFKETWDYIIRIINNNISIAEIENIC